jgi:hypothetical protein
MRVPEFERARNAEINSALVAYQDARFARERNAEINASIAAASIERGRQFALELKSRVDGDLAAAQEAEFVRAPNAEIDAAVVASKKAAFARARNAEIQASIAAVNARRLETGTINAARSVRADSVGIPVCSRYLPSVGISVDAACRE